MINPAIAATETATASPHPVYIPPQRKLCHSQSAVMTVSMALKDTTRPTVLWYMMAHLEGGSSIISAPFSPRLDDTFSGVAPSNAYSCF